MKISDMLEVKNAVFTRSPYGLLIVMQLAMWTSFSTWVLLINNFAVERAGFDGADWGSLQSIREVPGFLAFLVVYITLWLRERTLAFIALTLLAFGNFLTGAMPFYWGLLLATTISSIGFHYYEAINQSLQLQWLDKRNAPQKLGIIAGLGSFVNLLIYLVIWGLWEPLGFTFQSVFNVTALLSLALIAFAVFGFREFENRDIQNKGFVLRKRYWLFYLLQFLSGARRQIFVVFAGFMMIEKFGYKVHDMAALMLATYVIGTISGPLIGRLIQHIGERHTLQIEYAGLSLVFGSYMCVYLFDWPNWVAATLYLVDHVFFAMAIAIKTYFQKIADPKDIASTAAVSFTINHIAAVCLPFALGLIWLISPSFVFGLALALALMSFGASCLIPRSPAAGQETILS